MFVDLSIKRFLANERVLSHSKLLQTPTWHRHLFLKSTINIHNFIQLVLCRLSLWFVSQSKAFFFVPVLGCRFVSFLCFRKN